MGKRFEYSDLAKIKYVSYPVISDDGCRSAYVRYHGDEATGRFPCEVMLIDNMTGEDQCLTAEDHSEKQPYFMSDGSMLYLSDESGEWQVWKRYPADTDRLPQQITTLRHGIVRYTVSEASDMLAFEAVLWPEEVTCGSYITEMTAAERSEWKEKLDWTPYVATDLVYKMDEWYGMRKGEFSHIGYQRLDPEHGSAGAVILDTGGKEALYPAWSNDGTKLAFHCYPYSGARGRKAEVFTFDTLSGELRQITYDLGIYPNHSPIWTKDNGSVIATAYPSFDDHGAVMRPFRIDLETLEVEMLISAENGYDLYDVNPVPAGRTEREDYRYYMTLDESGNDLYFRSFKRGRGIVAKVTLGDPESVKVLLEADDIYSFALAHNGDIVVTMSNYYEPAELYLSRSGQGDRRTDNTPDSGRYTLIRLTRSNDWLGEYDLGKVTEGWTKSRDGKADLQYWIVTPPGADSSSMEKKYPAVFDAKGGPETCYGSGFWHEFQTLAAQGIVVIYGNPRGSVGYGRDFNKNMICWKEEAMLDHLTILDAAIEKGFIDTDHIGFTGGSYGGFTTMKLIGRTDTFTAAVAQRALANPVTSYGTGDIGFVSSADIPEGFSMKEYLKDRARGNNITYVDSMKTPLLILHASDDYRCGFEQAEQIFIPMHERNPEIPLRLVRFPGENHGLTRHGKLHAQMRHLKEMTCWFRKYLKDEPWTRIDTGAKYGCSFEGKAGYTRGK